MWIFSIYFLFFQLLISFISFLPIFDLNFSHFYLSFMMDLIWFFTVRLYFILQVVWFFILIIKFDLWVIAIWSCSMMISWETVKHYFNGHLIKYQIQKNQSQQVKIYSCLILSLALFQKIIFIHLRFMFEPKFSNIEAFMTIFLFTFQFLLSFIFQYLFKRFDKM